VQSCVLEIKHFSWLTGATTLSIATFGLTTLGISNNVTLLKRYSIFSVGMLSVLILMSVILLSFVILSFIILGVIILSFVNLNFVALSFIILNYDILRIII
jgi:hypothetical protein